MEEQELTIISAEMENQSLQSGVKARNVLG